MDPVNVALVVVSLLLFAQSAYTSVLMLYSWEDEDKHQATRVPSQFAAPSKRFSLLVPARDEAAVIGETLLQLAKLRYPTSMFEVIVIIEETDESTIDAVLASQRAIHDLGYQSPRLVTFAGPPISKPRGLNEGLLQARFEVLGVFDAEDEVHPDILNVINTAMEDGTPVVQGGVQLMNFADRWFSSMNVLEYFFWFRSRLHYAATTRIVPLGGNTVFFRRDVLEGLGGWDSRCLTEDADIGIRLSAEGVPIRVLYDDRYVTREETPPTLRQFMRQRTRWDQGFLQVLMKGDWLRLPTLQQRLLAVYTLAFPTFQAFTFIYLPLSLWMVVDLDTPVPVAMVTALPLYAMLLQFVINVAGLFVFTRAHGLRPTVGTALTVILLYWPYQFLLNVAALLALWRQARRIATWDKTQHVGAHRAVHARGVTADRGVAQ